MKCSRYCRLDMLLKKEAREIVFKKRKSISHLLFKKLNNTFYKNFQSLDFLKPFKNQVIAGYCAFDDECNIFEILKHYSKNNLIVLPSIVEKDEKMVFRKWSCRFDDLAANILFKKTKILEPKNTCAELSPTIVFVPAVAVDIYGNRAGYGGGYYDRTIKDLNCIKIATVFDFQVFDEEIEHNKNDVAMDYILTENRFFKNLL